MTARRRETKRPLVLPGMCCLCILLLTSSPGVSAAADRRPEVEAAMQEYARLMQATDAVRLSGSYTPDGELLEPGMEALKGPAAIRKFLESFGSVKIESASMTPETTEVFGNQAFQWGTYAQRVALPGKPPADYRGRFVAEWSRQASGKWLIRRLLTQPAPS